MIFVGYNQLETGYETNNKRGLNVISNEIFINISEIAAIECFTNIPGGHWSLITLKNGREFRVLGEGYHLLVQAGFCQEDGVMQKGEHKC